MRLRRACAGLVLVSTAAACGDGTVAVDEVQPPSDVAEVCSDLVAEAPGAVGGNSARVVEPPEAPAAAWGNPPIVLRCGVDRPDELRRDSPCHEIEGVGWFSEEADNAYVFTTIGRAAFVEVEVPDSYPSASDPLVDLAEPINDTVPEERPCV